MCYGPHAVQVTPETNCQALYRLEDAQPTYTLHKLVRKSCHHRQNRTYFNQDPPKPQTLNPPQPSLLHPDSNCLSLTGCIAFLPGGQSRPRLCQSRGGRARKLSVAVAPCFEINGRKKREPQNREPENMVECSRNITGICLPGDLMEFRQGNQQWSKGSYGRA